MSWTYNDYIAESDNEAKQAKLVLHIQEVSQTLSEPLSNSLDGISYNKPFLEKYLSDLKNELKTLKYATGSSRMFVTGRLSNG